MFIPLHMGADGPTVNRLTNAVEAEGATFSEILSTLQQEKMLKPIYRLILMKDQQIIEKGTLAEHIGRYLGLNDTLILTNNKFIISKIEKEIGDPKLIYHIYATKEE